MDCKHKWKQEYYGLRCVKCNLFYPDTCNWFAPDDDMFVIGAEEWEDDEDEEYHPYDCTCEDCLQNHPERDILYGDGEYFNWGEAEDTPPPPAPASATGAQEGNNAESKSRTPKVTVFDGSGGG